MSPDLKTTTAEALLGMLSLGPMSGYELRQMVADTIGNFWSESFGQIYPTLKRLEAEGLVSSSEDKDSGARTRRRYELTPSGRERLTTWLGVEVRAQVPRNELLLKLFFGSLVEIESSCRKVEEAQRNWARDLARYRGIEAALTREHAHNPGLPFWLITVRYGIAEREALLHWADSTLHELNRLQARRQQATGRQHAS